MPIGALFEAQGVTAEAYEAVANKAGAEPPEGCLVHIAGPTDDGWRVIEVWRSRDDQRSFQEQRLNPAFDEAGARRVEPTFFDVHAVLPPEEALASLAP